MHKLGVFVHQYALFSLKSLFISKKKCSFALEFLIRNRFINILKVKIMSEIGRAHV